MALTLRRVVNRQLTWDEVDANAGGSRRKERRRYLIGERQYWADESELPGLILAIAAKPEKQPAPVANRRAKAAKRPVEATKPQEAVQVASAPDRSIQARLEALRRQFQMAESEVLLRAAAIVAERLAEMEDDDEMVLLLA